MIKNDKKCKDCGAKPELLTCEDCGVSAKITDCGHFPQPRPLAADDTGHVLCDECYEAHRFDEFDESDVVW